MKKIIFLSLSIISLFSTLPGFSQNWMMAKEYEIAAKNDILLSDQEGQMDLLFFDYLRYSYDPENQQFKIFLVDTLSSDYDLETEIKQVLDESLIPALTVNLHGGIVTSNEIKGHTFTATVPDISDWVFLYNASSVTIYFSMSADDSNFVDCSLEKGQYKPYSGEGAEYLYIRMITERNGVETGRIHYQLEKGKGYKIDYDPVFVKFEVYDDNR